MESREPCLAPRVSQVASLGQRVASIRPCVESPSRAWHCGCSRVIRSTSVNWLSFGGWIILIIVLTIAAYRLGAEPVWIGIGALALIGIGLIASARFR